MTPALPGWIRGLRIAVPLLILGYAVLSIISLRQFVAVGSWTYLNGLVSEGFYPVDPYRVLGSLLAQAPFAVAVASGVSDLDVLQYVHGLGYILLPSILWAAALWISRSFRWFDLLVLAYCATALTSGFMAAADTNQLFAFTALCFAAAARFYARGGVGWAWLMTACALVLTTAHGLALLLAPFLIVAIIGMRRVSAFDARVPRILTLVLLAIATVVAIVAIIRPYSPANLVSASDMAGPLADRQLIFLFLWLAVLPLAVLARRPRLRLAAAGLLVASLLWLVLDERLWATPMQTHDARTFSAILMFLLLLVALQFVRQACADPASDASSPWLAGLSFALLIAFLVPAVTHTVRFHAYLRDFAAITNAETGYIPYADFVQRVPSAAVYGWSYSFPSTSELLGIGRDHAVVLSPEDMGWIPPFDPYDPPAVPERFTGSAAAG